MYPETVKWTLHLLNSWILDHPALSSMILRHWCYLIMLMQCFRFFREKYMAPNRSEMIISQAQPSDLQTTWDRAVWWKTSIELHLSQFQQCYSSTYLTAQPLVHYFALMLHQKLVQNNKIWSVHAGGHKFHNEVAHPLFCVCAFAVLVIHVTKQCKMCVCSLLIWYI